MESISFHNQGVDMHLYDSFARSPEEITAALAQDGAVLALDLRQFEVVVTRFGIMLQLRGINPSLAMSIPKNALSILLPHQERFAPPPPEAVRFVVSDHVQVCGTSR